ncbi:MAG TPA: DUF1462 family protein [Dehalococcoidia bacterium]|nr:DUF1462 family protein [Dehalococcoidia bacterium]
MDESSRKDCDVGCGTDWSSPDALALATRQVKDRFGSEAVLEYFDVLDETDNSRANEWRQKIRERDLSVPLLLINGHLRIAGQFDIRQVIDAVEAEMEMGT